MSGPKLLLWDIDGTLVCTDRAGEKALLESVRQLYQIDWKDELPIDLRGRTDRYIFRELLTRASQELGTEQEARMRNTYLSLLEKMLPLGAAKLHAGIQEALDAVHAHPEIHQGLLTGNLEEGAKLKLTHLGIWHYFEFGAFANDSANRNELGPFALRRAKEKLGIEFAPENVYIIGDTAHDIACGKAIGAKTIALATGAFSVAELVAEKPTYVFPDLSDTAALLKIILSS